jgi:hypothetical protein
MNRSQALVVGFFAVVWVAVLVILAAAPDIWADALGLTPGRRHPAEYGFVTGLTVFIALLVVGMLRRWRWVFWLIVVAFLFGVLRVPMAVLQLAGVIHTTSPTWYVVFQGLLGVTQAAIGLLLLRGYRRAGTWGAY